jgi:hypothetical protein
METKTIINILGLLIVIIVVFYYQKREKRKHDKYFGKNVKLTKKEMKIVENYKAEYETIKNDKRLPTIKKDNFTLDDISKLATEIIFDNPLPNKLDKENLVNGDLVKLVFLDKDNFGERMWVEFIEKDNGLLKGLLRNDALENEDLSYDKIIWFHPNHIFEIDKK